MKKKVLCAWQVGNHLREHFPQRWPSAQTHRVILLYSILMVKNCNLVFIIYTFPVSNWQLALCYLSCLRGVGCGTLGVRVCPKCDLEAEGPEFTDEVFPDMTNIQLFVLSGSPTAQWALAAGHVDLDWAGRCSRVFEPSLYSSGRPSASFGTFHLIAKEHLDPTAMTNNSDEPMDDAFIDTLPDFRATRSGEK